MDQRGQKSLPLSLVAAEGEDLFELIHGDHGARPLPQRGCVRFAQLHGKCSRLDAHLVGQRSDLRSGRVRPKRAGQLLERVGSRRQQQDADVRLLPSQSRNEAGSQDRALAASRGADERQEAGVSHAFRELGDDVVAAEELVRIRHLERLQAAIRRVAGRGRWLIGRAGDKRSEILAKAIDRGLVKPRLAPHVLELVRAQIGQLHAWRQLVGDEVEVVPDTRIWPPWPAAAIRAAR